MKPEVFSVGTWSRLTTTMGGKEVFMKDELKKIAIEAIERLDLKKVSSDLLDRALEPALEKLVKDSSLPFDDMLKAAIYPKLEEELKKIIGKEIDEMIKSIKE
jgi:hypothetical protein